VVKGPFFAVEASLQAGDCKEALSALKKTSVSAEPWEVLLWLGRIEEKRGRLAQAEQAFRKSASADPKAAPELFRFLEEEKYVAYQKALLAEAGRTPAGLARYEATVRASLEGPAPAPGGRTLLVEILLSRRRFGPAAAELAAAFRSPHKEDEASRIVLLLRLIDEGRYVPDLERALLECVSRASAADKITTEWPQIFSALMCAQLYPQAFRLGEAVLDNFGRLESPGQLMWPWWRKIRRAVAEDRFIDLELKRICTAAKSGKYPHWFAYYRAILLSDGSRNQDKAMLEYAHIKDLDAERYSWMLQSFVLVKLGVPDYPGAIAVSRDILSRAPSHWWVRCRMAEAYMAGGDVPQGLREFEEAGRTCGPNLQGEVLTWHGEALLWLGEYAQALEKLDAAVALGAKTFVFGWRGAARFKSGDSAGALEDLHRAVELDPKDFEARGWRAEAYRVMGRNAEALEDIKYVIANGPTNYWSHFNRALLRDALDDGRGMAADLEQAPKEMLALIMKKLKITRKNRRLTRVEMRRILTAGLDWAKGIRRWETYVQPIWMERLP
jgi:tetratricopeptide (TPR) repeat protein